MKKSVVVTIAALIAATVMLSGCGPDDKLSEPPITENERTFTEEEFENPALKYRPLPIIHADEYSPEGVNEDNLDRLKAWGYGGVGTNVSFNSYLKSEEMWDSYVRNIKYAIDVLGLRVWIYDELQYPSGAAGGLVLEDHPEWQAEGLVNSLTAVSGNTEVVVDDPHGHTLVFAKAFPGTNVNDMNLSEETDLMAFHTNGTLRWTPPGGDYVIVTQYGKYFYEGTHATTNWAELRRYINVLKSEPVEKFIDVTYEEYKSRVGEYFGKGIEAFFTDEPSMMGTYFDQPPTTPAVKDPVDPDIPLYPTVNYASDIAEKFQAARGYDMGSLTPYLFGGVTDAAKRFRWDYYKTLGELMAANYSGQIGAWCGENGVKASGHFLLEEDIYMHPVFNGNLLRNMSNMQMPGIDLLTAYPQTAKNWCATTAKFASSAAHFGGKTNVLSEVSDAFDGVKTDDMYLKLGAVAVQYAMGVNQIGTFYRPFQMTDEENKLFTSAIGRMGYLLGGGVHESRVAVYYPIEGVYIDTLPPEHLNKFNNNVKNTSANFTQLCQGLVSNQIDYDILDAENLSKCKVENGALVTPFGERFKAVVVPKTKALETAAAEKLLEAARGGVSVLMQDVQGVLASSEAGQSHLDSLLTNLAAESAFRYTSSKDEALRVFNELGVKSVSLSKANEEIVAVKHKYKNNSVFMFVNTGKSQTKLTVRLNEIGTLYRAWDVYTGEVKLISVDTADGETTATFTVPAGRCVFITVE